MQRGIFLILLSLTACTPEAEQRESKPAPAAAVPEVPFKDLGWDGSRYTLKDGPAGAEKPFTGVTTKHNKAGRLLARYGVKEGVYHGLVEEWYENGKQKTKTSYAHGRHEGDNFYWNPDGTLQVHKVWRDDVLISETPGTNPGAQP